MALKIILLTLGILALLESLLILIFPKTTMKAGKNLFKNVRRVKKVATWELVFALIFISLGLSLFFL